MFEGGKFSDQSFTVSGWESPVLGSSWEKLFFTSIFPEADRGKKKYEAEENEGRKAEHGANIDSPDLSSGFCLKKLRKWKSRASETNQRRRKQSLLRQLMCRQCSSELEDATEKIQHEKRALQGEQSL